ncbi:tryptophan synthase subunit alpha [Amorphoplanes nipponensis]|uniref:Tryptophan synthase alpha chain n=1 Tax=Actinoplanes nipponensis TaxID=135950 RepID=A0A919JL76_9ACTN|nr:tryptophan synthase subunit alpha [Actinoplanes nipponensis]GIE51452.1 tryptophan synthase alpha chain [Actinoplanes nipponensis]
MSTALSTALRADGRPLLVPYVTGGITADWTGFLRAYQEAGADAIEVGLPFSDPMLDGPTIQEASDRALARGATVESILADIAATPLRVPVIVMTYANIVLRIGVPALAAAGVRGLIVPDLPLEESAGLEAAAAAAGVDLVLLAAPSTPDDRLREIGARSRGFVYAISVMGTTGERAALAGSAAVLAARVKRATDLPVLIGFGVSTPAQAAEAGRAGDGVVIASALMRRVLDGATAGALGADVAALRTALDLGVSPGTPHAEVSGHRG